MIAIYRRLIAPVAMALLVYSLAKAQLPFALALMTFLIVLFGNWTD